jgi:hypothetical protein
MNNQKRHVREFFGAICTFYGALGLFLCESDAFALLLNKSIDFFLRVSPWRHFPIVLPGKKVGLDSLFRRGS